MELPILNNQACCTPGTSCCETKYPVAILGAGPIGLAAAAHLQTYNVPFILLEKGDVAANVATWEHVRLFSPWEYNVDNAARKLLEEAGWTMPDPQAIPTGAALRHDYLMPLSEQFKGRLYTNEEVIAITKLDADKMKSANREAKPFLIFTKNNQATKTYKASAIIDATGTWGHANPAASHGVFLPSERKLSEKITYQIPNVVVQSMRYANKKVAVIGSGHSAINSLLQLVKLKENYPQTEITWILRKNQVEEALGGGVDDELAARGELGLKIKEILSNGSIQVKTPFYVQTILEKEEGVVLKGTEQKIGPFDELIVNTGNRPDFSFHEELRYTTDPVTEAVSALADLIDPNHHSCGSVPAHGEKELRQPEPNFYIVGSKSYGRAPTFLMATGYEQVRSIAASIAGDTEAALNVQLSLPETGVCHTGIGVGGCCQ